MVSSIYSHTQCFSMFSCHLWMTFRNICIGNSIELVVKLNQPLKSLNKINSFLGLVHLANVLVHTNSRLPWTTGWMTILPRERDQVLSVSHTFNVCRITRIQFYVPCRGKHIISPNKSESKPNIISTITLSTNAIRK